VDDKLNLVTGGREGQPGKVPQWERFVKLTAECVEIGGKGRLGVAGSVTLTDLGSLTLVVSATGRIKLASPRTRAAMSWNVAAIRGPCGGSEGEELGV